MTSGSAKRFSIRVCEPQDAEALAELGKNLFVQAYGANHPEPDRSVYLRSAYDAPSIAREIGDGALHVVLAEGADGNPAGYASLRETRVSPDGVIGSRPIEILRFYVDQAWHGSGLAAALMTCCEDEARHRGGDVLWLQAWQEAGRALAFYRKAGFEVVGTTQFRFGARVDDDHVLAKRI